MKVELGFFSLNNPRSAVRSRAPCTALLTEDGEEAGKPPSASQVILKLGWSLENSFITKDSDFIGFYFLQKLNQICK